MKKPQEFAKTLYLGDRACKRLIIDGWLRLIALEMDSVIRIVEGSTSLEDDEKIENGRLVFEGVTKYELQPQGFLPCDWIDFVDVISIMENGKSSLRAEFAIGACGETEAIKQISLIIWASSFYLEDPLYPGVKICD
ncbi:MAG TPA: DUF6258 family protein [Verrucomicrobiae bacterium]|nr:DUF6258 family protein [Verrucomicrobiae bacterium]